MNELDREGAHDFTHPSSEFYPEFNAAIRAKINEWCPEEELEESDDEQAYRRKGHSDHVALGNGRRLSEGELPRGDLSQGHCEKPADGK